MVSYKTSGIEGLFDNDVKLFRLPMAGGQPYVHCQAVIILPAGFEWETRQLTSRSVSSIMLPNVVSLKPRSALRSIELIHPMVAILNVKYSLQLCMYGKTW